MLEPLATVLLVSAGSLFGLVILVYAVYITFFPLARSIGGGLQVLKYYGEQRAKATQHKYAIVSDTQLGLTMADGGERIKKKKRSARKTKKRPSTNSK